METNIHYEDIFPYNPEVHIFEVEESEVIQDDLEFLKPMFWGGYFDGKTIYIDKFLREDLSINLEKLELAVIVATNYREIVTSFDDPVCLYIDGLQTYYELRGITEMPKNMREEYYVIRGIIDAVANHVALKPPIKVAYVPGTAEPSSRG